MALNKLLKELIHLLLDTIHVYFLSFSNFFIPPKPKCVENEIVLITGAGSPNGIGHWLALEFASRKSTVVLWDIDKVGLETTANEIKAKYKTDVYTYICDVGNREEVYSTAAKVTADVGLVTILVNNAGVVNGRNFLDIPDENILKLFDVNLFAHFWTVKSFLPSMIEKNRGHIVNIASSAGLVGVNRLADYCASKFADVGFMESLHHELRRDGKNIRTTLVCPYYIDTGMFRGCETRFPSIFPKLKPDETATKIMTAILTDQETLYLPRMIYVLATAKAFLPVKVLDLLHSFFGADDFMDKFVGRQQNG